MNRTKNRKGSTGCYQCWHRRGKLKTLLKGWGPPREELRNVCLCFLKGRQMLQCRAGGSSQEFCALRLLWSLWAGLWGRKVNTALFTKDEPLARSLVAWIPCCKVGGSEPRALASKSRTRVHLQWPKASSTEGDTSPPFSFPWEAHYIPPKFFVFTKSQSKRSSSGLDVADVTLISRLLLVWEFRNLWAWLYFKFLLQITFPSPY